MLNLNKIKYGIIIIAFLVFAPPTLAETVIANHGNSNLDFYNFFKKQTNSKSNSDSLQSLEKKLRAQERETRRINNIRKKLESISELNRSERRLNDQAETELKRLRTIKRLENKLKTIDREKNKLKNSPFESIRSLVD